MTPALSAARQAIELRGKDWNPISSAPEGILVWTKIHDKDGERNEQLLLKRSNLWWSGDMYVYYQPTHWRLQT